MNETEKRIAGMVEDMDFERKKPVSAGIKKQTAELYEGVGEALKKLSRLHLGLWHAVEKNDYRSLPLDQARQQLADIEEQIGKLK